MGPGGGGGGGGGIDNFFTFLGGRYTFTKHQYMS